MRKILMALLTLGFASLLFSGCAGDNYNAGHNSYDNRSNYDRKMDHVAQEAAYDASSQLSASDIKNINNLK